MTDKKTKSKIETEAKPVAKAKDAGDATADKKTDTGDAAGGASKNYSRGEKQKPMTEAYCRNWNAIFGRKSGG
ncbi:MAG TPA: hypothetical protein VM325_19120 [Alphaproteobacteria bacterium]|nr:hypothetical protein [Alphaproteobacteria bacterium]